MKKIYFFTVLILSVVTAHSQLVSCRPKICMIDYNLHDDSAPNADMTAITATKPDILIDNTPHGYWGGGCLPSHYTPLGIKVFSYIHCSYETVDSNTNKSLIDGIALDGATGVFLDEVSSHPTAAQMAYITAMYHECVLKGLQMIINPGTNDFDASLMTVCDYIMTNEHYNGTDAPSPSETPFLDRVLVVSLSNTTATAAAAVAIGARAHGFGYSYACDLYTAIPSYLDSYMSMITQPPATPVITASGPFLSSNAPYGNQWYYGGTPIPGATSQTYVATTLGTYFDIVTLQGCPSDTSNQIVVIETTVPVITSVEEGYSIYPNPASDNAIINYNVNVAAANIVIEDVTGRVVYTTTLTSQQGQVIVPLSNYSAGLYMVTINSGNARYIKKLVKQ